MVTIQDLLTDTIPTDFNWQTDRNTLSPVISTIRPEPTPIQAQNVEITSECLRDGLHGVTIYPTYREQMTYIHALYVLGIRRITVGIYNGKNSRINNITERILTTLHSSYPSITPVLINPATDESIKWAIRCKHIHPNINSLIFIGTAPSRLLAEGWSKQHILDKMKSSISKAVDKHITVIGTTEHTTQTPPEFLRDIITTQLDAGAKRLCIADTIGIARPIGVVRIVRFIQSILKVYNPKHDIPIEYHGHNDTGNELANVLAAISAGATCVHAVSRGRGERAGNASLEKILINLHTIITEAGHKSPWNLKELTHTLTTYDRITDTDPPISGTLGERAFTTSIGIHVAGMRKAKLLVKEAKKLGYKDLANTLNTMANHIYSGINPHDVGREYVITIGHWSGKHTVYTYAELLGFDVSKITKTHAMRILHRVKRHKREISHEELFKIIKQIVPLNAHPQKTPHTT